MRCPRLSPSARPPAFLKHEALSQLVAVFVFGLDSSFVWPLNASAVTSDLSVTSALAFLQQQLRKSSALLLFDSSLIFFQHVLLFIYSFFIWLCVYILRRRWIDVSEGI